MLLIHVGFYRTGSTFLQKRVFPILDHTFRYESNLKNILDNLVYPNSLLFDEKKTKKIFKTYNSLKLEKKKIKILSYECFTGHPFSGGFNQNEIVERLKNVFPNAKILLIFREQRNHIKSMYKKYVKDGGKKKIYSFLNGRQSLHALSFKKSYLNYFNIINKYQSSFGKNRVLAIPYEMLNYDPKEFFKRISDLINVNIDINKVNFEKLNVSSKVGYFGFERIINNFQKRDPIYNSYKNIHNKNKLMNLVKNKINKIIPCFFLKKIESNLEKGIDDFFDNYFCESNKKLQKKLGFNLKKYGYKL